MLNTIYMKFKIFILILVLINLTFVSASSVTRSFSSDEISDCNEIEVTLEVRVTKGDTFYAIDESYPFGFSVIKNGGGSTQEQNHIKWVVLTGANDTQYTYTIKPSCDEGSYTFNGEYGFNDAIVKQIEGDNKLSVNYFLDETSSSSRGGIRNNNKEAILTKNNDLDESESIDAVNIMNGEELSDSSELENTGFMTGNAINLREIIGKKYNVIIGAVIALIILCLILLKFVKNTKSL